MLERWARDAGAFMRYVGQRFLADGCLLGSGALSYTTLVSLVPLIAIALSIFTAFPIFAGARDKLMALIFDNFVPEIGNEVKWWLTYFAGSAAHTTTLGVVALAITAILLLATIEDQLHVIWRVTTPRPWVQRILVYWTLLTLGPLLLGASLSLSGYFDRLIATAGLDPSRIQQVGEAWYSSLGGVVPFLLETVILTLVYCLVPNVTVRWRHGIIGAVVAAVTIEVLKIGFVWYISSISSYKTVYGALAAIPIFLLWMYVSWGAVLFGAVVAAALPEWRVDEGLPKVPREGRNLGLSLAIVGALAERSREEGGTMTTPELAGSLGVAAAAIDEHLGPLQQAGFVVSTTDGGWVLSRAPASATLADLYRALGLPLAGSWRERGEGAAWQEKVAPAMQWIADAEAGALRIPLASLLAGPPREATPPTPLKRRG